MRTAGSLRLRENERAGSGRIGWNVGTGCQDQGNGQRDERGTHGRFLLRAIGFEAAGAEDEPTKDSGVLIYQNGRQLVFCGPY